MNSGGEFDKKRGVNYHVAVFKNIFGGKDADYLTILIGKTRLDYMNNFIDRMEKRRNLTDWGTDRNRWDLSKFNTVKTEDKGK